MLRLRWVWFVLLRLWLLVGAGLFVFGWCVTCLLFRLSLDLDVWFALVWVLLLVAGVFALRCCFWLVALRVVVWFMFLRVVGDFCCDYWFVVLCWFGSALLVCLFW